MSEPHALQIRRVPDWHMALSAEGYDRRATLTEAERGALAEVGALTPQQPLLLPSRPATQILARLTQPLQDVYDLGHAISKASIPYLRSMCRQMAQTGKPFWAWSREDWLQTMVDARCARSRSGTPVAIRAAAYLLCGLLITGDQHAPFLSSFHLARIVFGEELVSEQYERLATAIFGKDGIGYMRNQGQEQSLRSALTHLMLVNRNPYIEALTVKCLHAAKPLLSKEYHYALRWIARALERLKIVREGTLTDLLDAREPALWWEYTEPDVDAHWLAWLQAYISQMNRFSENYRKVTFYYLIMVGRWLKKYHPDISGPDQWDEALAQDYVSWVCSAERGELVSDWMHVHQAISRFHAPLHPGTIDCRLSAARRFFKALQKRPYQVDGRSPQRLVLSWNPDEVFATPENIKRQKVPNPRNLDHSWWQKLTWAAASLSAKNLAAHRATQFPLAYYRAAGLVWVTGARRADEIRRLKVGCVSREWAPEMRDEEGNQLEPEEDLAYLLVPVNKELGQFWIPIPLYTADAIEVWERLRPRLQEPQIDRKEHKPTDYLFMMRNRLMGKTFLNGSVIPLLCKVAGLIDEDGVPLRDAIGKITSHRARSTLATWLRSNGLSLTYIAKLLGHTDLKMLPWYLREDKQQFARAIRKHNPLDRMVMAILDTEALKRGEGEPAVFYYLGYGSDGRPHLCASPDYQTCIHQMRCTECEMHVDAEQAEVIARRPGVLTIEVHIPTPPLVANLLDQEEELGMEITSHLPAPEVPSPAYHFNKSVPPRSSDPELDEMKKALAALTAELAEKEGKFDLRSVGMRSLKKRIADLAMRIEARETGRAV